MQLHHQRELLRVGLQPCTASERVSASAELPPTLGMQTVWQQVQQVTNVLKGGKSALEYGESLRLGKKRSWGRLEALKILGGPGEVQHHLHGCRGDVPVLIVGVSRKG